MPMFKQVQVHEPVELFLDSEYKFSTLLFSSILRAQSHAIAEKCPMHLIGDTNPTRTVYTTADSNLRHPAVSPVRSAHY